MACEWVLDAFTEGSNEWLFWNGVVTCYGGGFIKDQPIFMEGLYMAKECAPDPVAEPEAWKFTGVELKDRPGKIPLGHFSMVQVGFEFPIFQDNPEVVEPAPPLNAMYVPERDDEDAVPPPPMKTERLDGFNPAVEGYKPPVCVTESQMLADALGKIKTLEGKIGAMVDLMDKMADKYQDLESRVRELSDDRTHLWTAIRDRSIPND